MVTNRLLKMAFTNSKKYGSTIQNYTKKNGDISYYITYKDENNRLKRVKVGEKSKGITEAYCFQKRNELLSKIRLGEDIPLKSSRKNQYTFEKAFEHYLEWAKENKKTWKHNDYQVYYKHLAPYLAKKALTLLKPKDFEDLKQIKLKEGYKPKTVLNILGTARHIINYSIKHEYIKNYSNPISNGKVRLPKIDNAKVGFLSQEQAEELLDLLQARQFPTLYRLTVLLLHTGARFSEVASLNWSDINFRNRLIYFKPTKDGNPRHIYITDKALEVLNELKQEKKSNLIIPSTTNEQIGQMPRQWQMIVDEMIEDNKKAEKYKITPHSLRHTHASWLAISGMGIMQIKEQLGHRKLDMTMRYSHLIPDERHRQTREVFG
jgi:integrase